jgi:hypothetical protein
MAELVTLTEDGPLGKEGDQVWVDDPADVKPSRSRKSADKSDPDES